MSPYELVFIVFTILFGKKRHLDERKDDSIWLKSSCGAKKIEDCKDSSWTMRKENKGAFSLGVKEGLSISYGVFKYVILKYS